MNGRVAMGWAAGLAAVTIWAAWIVWTRAAVGAVDDGPAPTAWDLAFFRFSAPALLLAPLWFDPARSWRDNLAPPEIGWPTLAALQLWGAPFVLFGAAALETGDAALFAALTPGAMPLWAAAIAAFAFGVRPGAKAVLGLALIAVGVVLGVTAAGGPQIAAVWASAAAIGWACFTLALARSGLSPARAAGLVGAHATLIAIAGGLAFESAMFDLEWRSIAWHWATQGLLSGVAALLAFGAAVRSLGALRAAALTALVPPLAAGMAAAQLNEHPTALAWFGLAATAVGVALARTSGERRKA